MKSAEYIPIIPPNPVPPFIPFRGDSRNSFRPYRRTGAIYGIGFGCKMRSSFDALAALTETASGTGEDPSRHLLDADPLQRDNTTTSNSIASL